MKMSNKKLSVILAVSIFVLSPLGLLMRQQSVMADCPPFVPDALCPSNKPIPRSRTNPVGPTYAASVVFKNNTSETVSVAYALQRCWGPSGDNSGSCSASIKGFWTVNPGESKSIYNGYSFQDLWLHIHNKDWSYEHKPSNRRLLALNSEMCERAQEHNGGCRLSREFINVNEFRGSYIYADRNFLNGVLDHGNTYTFFKTNISGEGGTFTFN